MRSLGFGLERIGLLVLKAPRPVAVVLLVLFVAGAVTLPRTSFDGRLIDILSEDPAYQSYTAVKENFRDASNDVFLMVKAPDLFTVDGMEALRFFHIDLSLDESVESVFSVFSLGDFDFVTGRFDPALPRTFDSNDDVVAGLTQLRQDQPSARALVAPDSGIAIIVVTLQAPINADNTIMAALVDELEGRLDSITPPGFTVAVAGLPAIQATVSHALKDDQWRLALSSFVIGILIGLVVFRSLVAAFVCAAPAAAAVVWLLAVLNTLGIQINFLFAILPSLALILALVDSIVFFFHWQSANAENGKPRKNLKESILRVGPASAMTSITTALAFASLAYAPNPALQELAWLGVTAVAIAFLAFILVLPLLCLVLVRLPGQAGKRRPSFVRFGNPIGRWAVRAPYQRAGVAVLIAIVLGVVHFQVGSNFEIERYLPPDANVVEYEKAMGDLFGGTMPLYGIVAVPEGSTFYDPPARERIAAVTAAFTAVLGEGTTVSLANIWDSVAPDEVDAAAAALADAGPATLDRILSHDQRLMLVTAQLPSTMSGDQTEALIDAINARLDAAGLGNEVELTGFPILSGVEIPKLVEALRSSLLLAIGLAVIALAVASGSLSLALTSLVPNVLPILSVEAVLWLTGLDHDLTTLIALTVAFGIGIDNAVHLINMYRVNRNDGLGPDEALTSAVRIVGPALIASTAILSISYLATQISAMPSIGLLGQLIIATLLVALVANLVFLPSFIALRDRIFRRRRATRPADSGVP
jgi:predicted RND superfamily exporter protein